MAFCLPPADAQKFIKAINDGTIDVEALMNVDDATRREVFSGVVGDNLAQGLNAAYEEKLLLKDQKKGLLTWVKQSTASPKVKAEFEDKVAKIKDVLSPANEKDFYADFASKKLGFSVTVADAKEIVSGAKQVEDFRKNWNPTTQEWSSFTDRMKYGLSYVTYQMKVGEMMRDANRKTFKEWVTQENLGALLDIANASKGIVASLDNSFFGRQGVKALYTQPDIWGVAFAKSWVDIAKTLAGRDPMIMLKAEIYSRPNAMNGKYRNTGLAVGLQFEEAFPTALPERIPILGRLYKASENAFTGGAIRLRADMGDRFIAAAERQGLNLSTPGGQAKGLGSFVNSLTGRGDVGQAFSGPWVNAALFSARFFKSNWNTLSGHSLGFGIEKGPMRQFVRKQAALNLIKIIGVMAAQMAIAGMLWPDSVELDPRSSNFGKIKIGDTRFDISGGMASLVSLAARLIPTFHNGELNLWTKSSSTGKYTKLLGGKFGARTGLDVIEDFIEGKASPAVSMVMNTYRGTDFAGNKNTITGGLLGAATPLPFNTAADALQDPKAAPLLAVMLLDAVGFGASTYGKKQVRNKHPKEIWEEGYFDNSTLESMGLGE